MPYLKSVFLKCMKKRGDLELPKIVIVKMKNSVLFTGNVVQWKKGYKGEQVFVLLNICVRKQRSEVGNMKRIWNALRYGDGETRKCIGSVILFSVVAVVLIVVSGISGKFGLFIAGMIAAMIAILVSQTFTLVDDDFVAEVDGKGNKDTVRSVSVMKNGVSSRNQVNAKDTMEKKLENDKSEEKKDNRSQEREESGEEKLEKDGERKKKQKNEPDEKKKEEVDRFDHYNEQLLKKIRKKYHVKKDHRPILIDSSRTYGIKECPAFIWRVHNKVYLLLIEKEPRKICISRDMILNMGYVSEVRADKTKEYLAFQKDNLITGVFGGFIPDYFDSKAKNANLKYKHLYEIYPDIRISNRSAAQVMDLLYLNFMPKDKITQSEKLNGYFKRIYAAHIMYQDRVYSITEYKEAVENILKELCYAEMPDQEFVITLENLVKGRMISSEYANHYMEYRGKVQGRMVEYSLRR